MGPLSVVPNVPAVRGHTRSSSRLVDRREIHANHVETERMPRPAQALRRRVEQSLALARRVRMLEKQLEDATGDRDSGAGRLKVRQPTDAHPPTSYNVGRESPTSRIRLTARRRPRPRSAGCASGSHTSSSRTTTSSRNCRRVPYRSAL